MEDPMSRLTHDLIAEILSRVPYKSLCICKCVSPAWRDIIADPVYRKKIAQSLAGFFYHYFAVDKATAGSDEPCFVRGVNYADLSAFSWSCVPRTSPRLPLPLPPDRLSLADSCDGLFLACICTGAPEVRLLYTVSNPCTGEYAVLPDSGDAGWGSYLGFDSGVSTEEFHVFQFIEEWLDVHAHPPVVRGLKIYSSKTGIWVSMESQWDIQVSLRCGMPGVFHKGFLHLLIREFGLAIVDAEGLKWRTIRVPNSDFIDPSRSGFIGKSAGQIFYINSDNRYGSDPISTISVYLLSPEVYHWDVSHLDDVSMHWKLLHEKIIRLGSNLEVVGVHPHANIIFITNSNNELLAYDLDHDESTTVYHINHKYERIRQFFPYVPLSSRLPLDGGMQLATPHRYGGECDVPCPDSGGHPGAEVPLHCLQSIYERVRRAAPLWLHRLLLQLLLWLRQQGIH